jgi:hypothetical protein
MSSQYLTAVCRSCGKLIFKGEGIPNKKGEWTCDECDKVKKKGKEN